VRVILIVIKKININMRNGTIILLGAGASVDVGYPLSQDLFDHFYKKIAEYSQIDLKKRKYDEEFRKRAPLFKESFPNALPEQSITTEKWFNNKWKLYKKSYHTTKPLIPPDLRARAHLGQRLLEKQLKFLSYQWYG